MATLAATVLHDTSGEVLGVSACSASGTDLVVSVQGDGILAYNAAKQVRLVSLLRALCFWPASKDGSPSFDSDAIDLAQFRPLTNARALRLVLQRCVRTWPLGSRRRLVCPAVYDALSQHYYAAVSTSDSAATVVAFTEETVSPLDEMQPLLSPKTGVTRLYAASGAVPAPQNEGRYMEVDVVPPSGGVVVLSGSGSLHVVASTGAEVATLPAAGDSSFVEASASGIDGADSVCIAVVTCSKPARGPAAAGTHKLNLVAVCKGCTIERVAIADLVAPQAECQVISVASLGRRSAAVMWSTGTWEVYAAPIGSAVATRRHSRAIGCFQLESSDALALAQQHEAAGAAQGKKRRAPVASKQAHSNGDAASAMVSYRSIAMTAMGGDYILLLGASSEAHGQVMAVLLDAHYGAVHAASTIATGCTTPLPCLQCITLAAPVRGQQALLAASLPTRVLLLRVDAPPVSLASALGMLTLSSTQRVLAAAELRRETSVQGEASPVWQGAVVGHANDGMLASRVDPTAVWDLGKMQASNDSNAARVELLTEVTSPTEAIESVVQQLIQEHCVSPWVVNAAIQRCLRDARWAMLSRIVEAGLLTSTESLPDLIPALVAAQQYSTLSALLTRARDVPAPDLEACLVAALEVESCASYGQAHHTLRQAAAASLLAAEAAVKNNRSDVAALVTRARVLVVAAEEFPAWQAVLLHSVIAAHRDDGAAAAAAAALSTNQVLTVLAYLNRWLRLHRGALGTDSGIVGDTSYMPGYPTLAHCISWASALIDTHFSRLVMHDAGAALLLHIASAVKTHVSATSALANLDGVVRHLTEGRPLPSPAGTVSALYSIERMTL